MNSKFQKFIAQSEIVMRTIVIAILVVGWIALMSYEDHLDRTSPPTPDSATGEVIPVKVKSEVLYMRPFDAEVIAYTGYGTVIAVVGGFIFILALKPQKIALTEIYLDRRRA